MKNLLIALSFTFASLLQASAMTHQNCVIVTGSRVQDDIVDLLSAKGYRPIVDDEASEGDLYLSGDSNCGIRRGIFQWQVCVARIEIYLKLSNNRAALMASGEGREELNYEFTNRYPRTEAKLSAIHKMPNCSVAAR